MSLRTSDEPGGLMEGTMKAGFEEMLAGRLSVSIRRYPSISDHKVKNQKARWDETRMARM